MNGGRWEGSGEGRVRRGGKVVMGKGEIIYGEVVLVCDWGEGGERVWLEV